MKVVFFTILFILSLGTAIAQQINLELITPSQFQDADVGSMAFGDIDNDGDNDLMITGKGTPMSGPILSTLYINDGSGIFSEQGGSPFENVYGGTVGFEDVDNDGDLDLLITGNTQGGFKSAKLYLNDGTGIYSLLNNTPFVPVWGGDFAFGDMDGDGDKDLIYVGITQDDIGISKLYLNNGSGIFSEITVTPFDGLKNSSVEFIDIDGDNDPDLIMAGENNNASRITKLYTNDGTGNFTMVANTPFSPIDGGDIAVSDSDNDGDQDLLLSGETANGVTISELYINDGTGSFSLLPGTPFPGTFSGASNFADFDNDGDQDVLIVGAGAGIVANIYENLGANSFILADTLPGAYLASTAIGDMDGDGDIDLVIGGTSFTQPLRSTKTYINISSTVGITDEHSLQNVSVYPNPSNGNISIELSHLDAFAIRIYSISGELVYSDDYYNNNSPIQLNQSPGLYLIVIITKNATLTRKLIVK